MLGIGFWELILVFVIAIFVYKPKDMVYLAFFFGRQVSKLQNLQNSLRYQYQKYLKLEQNIIKDKLDE